METLENHKLKKVDINRRKKTRERQNNQKAKHKMAVVNPYISVITLNVNRLNLPIKSQNGWIDLKKNNTQLYATYGRLSSEDTHRLKVKGWQTVFQAMKTKRRQT